MHKNKSKWIKDPNMKTETLKMMLENIDSTLHDIGKKRVSE